MNTYEPCIVDPVDWAFLVSLTHLLLQSFLHICHGIPWFPSIMLGCGSVDLIPSPAIGSFSKDGTIQWSVSITNGYLLSSCLTSIYKDFTFLSWSTFVWVDFPKVVSVFCSHGKVCCFTIPFSCCLSFVYRKNIFFWNMLLTYHIAKGVNTCRPSLVNISWLLNYTIQIFVVPCVFNHFPCECSWEFFFFSLDLFPVDLLQSSYFSILNFKHSIELLCRECVQPCLVHYFSRISFWLLSI